MQLLKLALVCLFSSSLITYDIDALAKMGARSVKSGLHRSRAHGKGKPPKDAGDLWERIRQGIRIPRPAPAGAVFGVIPDLTSKHVKIPIKSGQHDTEAIVSSGDGKRLTTVLQPRKAFNSRIHLPERLEVMPTGNAEKLSENSSMVNKEHRYTALGKLRFAKKESAVPLSESLYKKLHSTDKEVASKSEEITFNSPRLNRIRTRLGFKPKLSINDSAQLEEATDKKPLKKDDIANTSHHTLAVNCANLFSQTNTRIAHEYGNSGGYSQQVEICRNKQNAKVERVNNRIAGYSSGYLQQVSERARPYLFHIVDSLSKYGLPLDLALLPIVESAYQPKALSPKSAAGIWQFIPSTASEFGMEQNEFYDARLDITESTHAAIRFLSGLNAHFKGDWLLALAAYNSGQGTVDAAIARNQAEGLDTDFWALDLPAETEDYVPRLLALATIFQNPAKYGLSLRPVKNEPYFIKVNIDQSADIKRLIYKELTSVAKLADFDADQFKLLNSAHIKDSIMLRKPFTLLMPISNANLLHQSLAFMAQTDKVAEKSSSSIPAKTTIDPISDAFSVLTTQSPLLSLTPEEKPEWLFSTSKQVISFTVKPTNPSHQSAKSSESQSDYWVGYYLDKGETVKMVAEKYGLSEEELRHFNKMTRKQTAALGKKLLLPLKQSMIGSNDKKTLTSVLFKKEG